MKDWTGNSKTTFVQLGASSHSEKDRETNDYYATDPHSLDIYLEALKRDHITLNIDIWECACGEGHLSKLLEQKGYRVKSTDLVDRGYGLGGVDFINTQNTWGGVILTNPPYKYAKEFVEHAIELINVGEYVIMFLKIQFLVGQERRKLFDKKELKYVYVNSKRQTCYINGDMSKKLSSVSCYCWFMWQKGFKGEPIIRWI